MRKLNKTETYLRNARQRFNKTHKGVGAFLPTVGEFRKMNEKDKRFYVSAVKSLKAKTPYQRSRDIYKARTTSKLMYHFQHSSGFETKRKVEMQNYKKQIGESTLALDAMRGKIFTNEARSLPKKQKNKIAKQQEMRAENQKDYMNLLTQQMMYTKTRNGNSFTFKNGNASNVKDALLKYDAYNSSTSDWVVITDTTKQAKNGSPRGTSVPSLMREYRGLSVEKILQILGQNESNYLG